MSKQFANQLDMYTDGMQKTIMHSLSIKESSVNPPNVKNAQTLGGQILNYLYNRSSQLSVTLELAPTVADGGSDDFLSAITGVTIKFTPTISDETMVVITQAKPFEDEVRDADGNLVYPAKPREPKTAEINMTATVTVTAEYRGKSIKSVAVYNFTGGFIEDHGPPIDGNEDHVDMYIDGSGDWGFVSVETVDNK